MTSHSGRVYEVRISLPLGYESGTSTYPAAYVLDGNGQFGMTTDIARYFYLEDNLPGLIIVGVGYPVGQFFNAIRPRAFDLTPDREMDLEQTIEGWLASKGESPPGGPVVMGGADQFLTFLTSELIPKVESTYRVDETGRTLIGHSLGGLFALHTLLEQPEVFDKFLVISPHVPGASPPILQRETERHTSGWSPHARLYMTAGDNDFPDYAEGARRVAERLSSRKYPSLQLTFGIRKNESHNSVVPGAISTGLRWLHAGNKGIGKPGASPRAEADSAHSRRFVRAAAQRESLGR